LDEEDYLCQEKKMLRIRIIAVGKLKEDYFQAAQAEYLKRLKPYAKMEMKEVPDLPCPDSYSPAQEERVRQREGEAIAGRLGAGQYLIALDRNGKQLSSIEFAELIKDKESNGVPITMVIGGSLGLAEELLKKADRRLSFSEFTFPHQLFRVMLLEQIYRACKINRGERYHK
jgi:23S rRNA (pseudouridine1915-N3)-methyltransferase